MVDFSVKIYEDLLKHFILHQYAFQRMEDYFLHAEKRFILLRHDVDLKPENALIMAKIEASLGIKSTYYFRIVKKSFNEKIINEIIQLGHEIGYHYEDFSATKGNYEMAITRFKFNLEIFRQYYPVKTICMHGSPMSKYDNRTLWQKFNYKDFGILGEPYLDIDFTKVFYLTDTGRRWNGKAVSVRDKIKSHQKFNNLNTPLIKTTFDILESLKFYTFPNQVMITTHPQRWTDNKIEWLWELWFQNFKNIIKKGIILLEK